ncbi:eukaryotic porin-domain-containing protein [Vararia minispora EC-137]|uniref:Eukaryotic porin-domain-containing protein n=1 Tax=Vararia minispora EC-137 TaxID=1314806 RepID=A0ACB8QJ46_9AGAM|nr:eukaryotic porin-domain-containing protein [Vararia minispora EC-137]
MAAVSFPPPPTIVDAPAPSSSKQSAFSAAVSPLANAYNRFSSWRASLGLPGPGTVENLGKEAKQALATNFLLDGARADMTKVLSVEPAFQVTHSFQLASQSMPSSYNLATVFATQDTFMQGNVDNEGNVTMRFNKGWSPSHTSKVQGQFSTTPGHNMLQLEHDYLGSDYSLNAKAINLSPTDGTGMYVGSYLQSVTKNLAIGSEVLYQNAGPGMADFSTSWLAKLSASDKSWIGTAQVQAMGILQASYWHKLSEKVEAAAELQLIAAPSRRDAIATVGAKYDLRMSQLRAQIDSTGKVGMVLEQKIAPTFMFTISGELDHFKNAAKIGVGVMIESSSLTPEEMGMVPQPGSVPL